MTPEQTLQEEMDRDILIETALTARTQEQCDHAERLIIAWMKEHPRDFGMLDAGEQLAMMSERYDRPAGQARTPSAAGTESETSHVCYE